METKENLLKRITPVFQQVFNRPDLVVDHALTATQVEEWDSLNHISLIVALEEKFGFEFSTEELAGMQNVGDFLDVLVKKGIV